MPIQKKSAGARALRVLYAGSSVSEMRSAVKALNRDGFTATAELVQTGEEFALRLHTTPDVAFAELGLPGWSTTDPFSIWQQEPGGIPLILIASPADEEEAIECVKRGATDYVLKSNLE